MLLFIIVHYKHFFVFFIFNKLSAVIFFRLRKEKVRVKSLIISREVVNGMANLSQKCYQ